MRNDQQISFGEFRFDPVNECLWRDDQALLLRPKAFAVLKYLIERPGQLVTKQTLLDVVWPDTYVGDAVLKDSVRQLRDALEDDAKSPQYIETAHRRGYRFIGRISENKTTRFAPPEITENSNLPIGAGFDLNHFADAFSSGYVVGRANELAQMQHWFEKMLRGERQIILVTGEPGIGKTTLVEAFLKEVAATHRNIYIGRGQCLEQYGEGEAYLPVLEAISRLGRAPQSQRFVELLSKHAPTWIGQIPSLKNAVESGSQRQQSPGATREGMLREMAEAVEALTAETPLILLLEDLHWSDYSTLDLVSYLARRREPARLMLIGTYRPVEVILSDHPLKGIKRELQMHRLCSELPLGYLTEEAVAEYIEEKFPGHQFPPELVKLIHHRTGGNPLFMINVADYLVDERIVAEKQGHWQLQIELSEVELEVPENIRHLIEKQLERLSPEEQQVLEGASVVGMDCSSEAISSGMDEDIIKIEEICDRLARHHQFLLPAYLAKLPDGTITPRYRFMHVLYLDVIYKRVSPTRRAQIHRRIGERGEQIYGNRAGEIAAELAVHFEQARDWERAVKYLQLAAENALLRFANHESVVLAQRGLELIRTLPEDSQRDTHETALRNLVNA